MQPLNGIKVLDFSQFLSGPFCTLLLGDMGAEIIKVEPPIGELLRLYTMMTKDATHMLNLINRNKKAITVNLRTPKGIELMKELIKYVDVVVENFPPGMMDKLGLGYETVRSINPRLIYASISGFGKTGPLKDELAFDMIAQASSGTMAALEKEDEPPKVFIGDLTSGVFTAFGVSLALYQREITGEGQSIDTSLLDVLYGLNIIAQGGMMATEEQKSRFRNENLRLTLYNIFKAKDGNVAIVAITDKEWIRLLKVMGRLDLKINRKYKNIINRVKNCDEVEKIVQNWVENKNSQEIIELLREARIPCAKVAQFDDLIDDPQLKARKMIQEIDSSKYGKLILPGPIIKMSGAEEKLPNPFPELGEQNEEIYINLLGYTIEDITEWKKNGII
ncbi:MAG: CaiB/BaiF CoA transferase family protein [Promethearchaeota archaeon]